MPGKSKEITMATPAPKILVPTRDSEEKRAREEEAAQQRMEENGRSILTMWIIGHMIQQHRWNFHLAKECYPIIAVFSTFTNLAESGIQFDEFDLQFLRDFEEKFKWEYLTNNFQFQEELNCRELWKRFLKAFCTSEGFARFEAKFAAKIVLPSFWKKDGAMLTLSDNLFFLDKLTKFLKHLSMRPTLTQQMSSFYALSGLTECEKTQVLYCGKKKDHFKHQLKLKDSKLATYERKLKEEQQMTKSLQTMLEQEQQDMSRLIKQNTIIQQELDALRLAVERADNVRVATCLVCMSQDDGKSGIKLTPCCGHPLCVSCFENIKKTQKRQNPNCPNCRLPIQIDLTLITDNHPIYRRVEPKRMICVETMVDPADFLEAAIGGPAIDPIPKPTRKPPSIYAQLLCLSSSSKEKHRAGGSSAARPGDFVEEVD
jgi:hypothetical protein